MINKSFFNHLFTVIIGITGALLLSFSMESESKSFDVHDKNIGFRKSPDPINDCVLMPQAVTGTTTTVFRGAAVEPSIAVNPKSHKHVVAVWQQDRISTGGALELGIGYSNDGGKKWKRTTIPFQNCTGGFTQTVTDPWLSYSADGKKVYLIALPSNTTQDPNNMNQEGVVVSVSHNNGKSWSCPHFVAASLDFINEPTGQFPFDDKTSITADPNIDDNAYAVWERFPMATSLHADSLISRTTNGGKTWSDFATLYDPFPDVTAQNLSNNIFNDVQTLGNIIVGLPNGDLLDFMVRIYAAPGATNDEYINDSFPFQFTLFDIAVVRSTDHGVTWDTAATQITTIDGNFFFTNGYTYNGMMITGGVGELIRGAEQLFDVAVNPHNGNLYVVWQSGQFRADQLPQIALSSSRNGGITWSTPIQVNQTPQDAANPQAFTPAVAITKDGKVGIMYSDFRKNKTLDTTMTKTDVWFDIYKETSRANGGSTGMGLNFIKELRVSKHSYIMENGPDTPQGVMTNGDYDQIVAQGDDFYAIYIQSHHGPFTPAQTISDNIATETILLLDNNYRTSPFFSKIDA